METSVFIAKVLGPYFLIVGIGMLVNRQYFQKVLEDYFKNAALVFFTGMAPLAFGLVIAILHNTWVANWTVLITIFGWGGIIKGVWILLFPDSVSRLMQAYIKNKSLLMGHSVLAVVLGLFLSYMGYFAS
jgi:hypothetical protein